MYVQNCVVTEIFDKPGLVQIDGLCPVCKEPWKLCLTQINLVKYMNGEKVQKCFPGLNDSDRELLVSGICKECYDEISDGV